MVHKGPHWAETVCCAAINRVLVPVLQATHVEQLKACLVYCMLLLRDSELSNLQQLCLSHTQPLFRNWCAAEKQLHKNVFEEVFFKIKLHRV